MEVFKAFPRDRIQQRFVEQITSTIQLLTVVEEVLVEVFKASPRDRAQQWAVEQISSFLHLLTVVEEVLMEVFKASPRDRAQQRTQISSFLQLLTVVEEVLVEVFTASPRDRAQPFCESEDVDISVPHGRGKLGDGVFSASSAGAADEGPAVRGSGMGKAGFAGEDAPRGSSSRGKAGSTGDDAPRVQHKGLAQDRVQQRFVDAGLLDRSSWSLTLPGVRASSSPCQRRTCWLTGTTSGFPRPTWGAFSQVTTSRSPSGSCPLVGGKRSTWRSCRGEGLGIPSPLFGCHFGFHSVPVYLQSLVRCWSCLRCSGFWYFLGDDFRFVFVFSAQLGLHSILALRQSTWLIGRFSRSSPGLSPYSALSLVRQRIHAVRQFTRLSGRISHFFSCFPLVLRIQR